MIIDRKNTAGGNYLNEAGFYEVFIYSFETGRNSNGSDALTVNYKVRRDIQQPHQGAELNFAHRLNDSEIGQGYLNALIVAAQVAAEQLPDGQDVTMKQIGTALLGKVLLVENERVEKYNDPSKEQNHVKNVVKTNFPDVAENERKNQIKGDVTNGETNASRPATNTTVPNTNTAYTNNATQNNQQQVQQGNVAGGFGHSADPFANNGQQVDITDDDLPF